MIFNLSRIENEKKGVSIMIKIYCAKHHKPPKDQLCSDCKELLIYANKRLTHCPYQNYKGAGSKCSIHCYNQTMREKIKTVMRYAGPRMYFKTPILALLHGLIGFRKGKREK
ncbi:hypothetical protein MCHI_003126 [Candidatus Magnetoovum chiemensis]|nr:hypothetical protein MCHI_003126 [Candidatus Magnetoovum chiemensis]